MLSDERWPVDIREILLLATILPLGGRVLELAALIEELAPVRIGHARVVLTNGVFDLLHVGHLRYLRQARALGDLLVVGINADATVGALKPGRPLVPESERAELVAALEPVDYATIFAEPTADALLRALRPSVYVKGGDYTEASLPEAASARALGAELAFVPLVADHSSSALAESLRALEG
jgi:D-beta-D-heptose 7-phosphate kinase/D-beta-D-heptose 1-phosphate adenosyltransferase